MPISHRWFSWLLQSLQHPPLSISCRWLSGHLFPWFLSRIIVGGPQKCALEIHWQRSASLFAFSSPPPLNPDSYTNPRISLAKTSTDTQFYLVRLGLSCAIEKPIRVLFLSWALDLICIQVITTIYFEIERYSVFFYANRGIQGFL